MLQRHVRFWLESHKSSEDVGKSVALLAKGVDHRSSGRRHGSLNQLAHNQTLLGNTYLKHIAQNAQNAVEATPIFGGCDVPMRAPLNSCH